jgi:NAD(P)-dependent dehydrogenase (short-subunit alcohol dehydrogenase family)
MNTLPDQHGRTAVITGANSGVGLEAARELARAGAHVVLACRDTAKGAAAAETIRKEIPSAELDVAALDLASLDSVRAFAELYPHERLDLLINNAGVMAAPYTKTVDGFELQFATNHLGHFALAGLLLDKLLRTPGARVVTVSSTAHKMGRIDFDDLQSERSYRRWRAYGQSKLANLLFTFELDRRLRTTDADLLSVAAHPGYSATNLQFAATPSRIERRARGDADAVRGNRGHPRGLVRRTRRLSGDARSTEDRQIHARGTRSSDGASPVGGIRAADRCPLPARRRSRAAAVAELIERR